VLKYRTLQQDPSAPRGPVPGIPGPAGQREELVIVNGNANPAPNDAALATVLELAVAAGFGMTKRGSPVDGWSDRLHGWLVARQLTRQN
jgi:hypothetical protein